MVKIFRRIWENWIKPYLAVEVAILSAVLYVLFNGGNLTRATEPSYLNFLRVFGSLLLSALLFSLYAQMASIQSRQTEIMDADLRPVLEIQDVIAVGDGIGFELINIGNNFALDPEIYVHILCYDSYDPEDKNELLLHLPSTKNKFTDEGGNVVEVLITDEKYKIESRVCVQSIVNPSLDRTLSEVLDTALERHDFDQLYYQVEISYDHLMSEFERGHKFLQPYRVPLQSGMDMKDLHDNRENIQRNFAKFTQSKKYPFREPGTHYFTRD